MTVELQVAEQRSAWYQREPAVIIWLLAVSAVLFVVAYTAKTTFQRRQDHMARQWFANGERALRQSKPAEAIEDFRSALVYAPENREYRLRLAQALASAGRNQEAAAHLLNLWETEPGNGELNLELARLAVRLGNSNDALRYFHAAIYGLWSDHAEEHRRESRWELIRFLLAHDSKTQAQSELLALMADLPASLDNYNQAASLFMQAGDEVHALQLYRSALRLDKTDPTALAGAGQASFALGDYPRALLYFKELEKVQPLSSELAQLAATAEAVTKTDPFANGLTSRDRSVKVISALNQAGRRLQQCATLRGQQLTPLPGETVDTLQTDYLNWTQLKQKARSTAAQRDPNFMQAAMDQVYQIEEHTRQACGEPTGADLALLLLSRPHAERNR